jgi:phosphopantetheinyl transferase
MPAAERGARVLMHWSAKEAFGKGQGSGLPFEALQRIEALPAGADRDANACIGFRKAQDGGDHVIAVWAGDRVLPQLHWHGGAEEAAVFRWSDWCVVGRD